MKNKLVSATIYSVLILLVVAYISVDYFVLKPAISVNTGISYWIGVGVNILLIIIAMILTRLLRKSKKIEKNENIHNYQSKLDNHFKIIANHALYEDLERFIVKHNEDTKYATYIRKMNYKISKCKNPEKKKKLIAKREITKEEVLKMNIKYTRISSTSLYSNVLTKANEDPNEIKIHDFSDTLKMLGTKTLGVIVGALFTGGIFVDVLANGTSVIVSTVLKVIMMSTGIIMSILQADNFVDGEIEGVLRKRLRISISFINSTPQIKQAFGVNIAQNSDYKPENSVLNAQICENIAKNDDYN